jgi:phosphoribosylglycinamide formyltransferase-1
VTNDPGPHASGRVPVLANDTADSLAKRVLATEHQIYPRAIRHWLQQRQAQAGESATR